MSDKKEITKPTETNLIISNPEQSTAEKVIPSSVNHPNYIDTNTSNPTFNTSTGPLVGKGSTLVSPAGPLSPGHPVSPPQLIVEEFQYLLEKSQQLFAGVRELPPISGRQWQPYFQRTFEIYTKLWKFQQLHRVVLENKEYYGLKRWEVGEIASKIGQLYYHYYLRTSDTNYLQEAYIFYEAIHERAYFKDVLDAKNPAQMIKKLRYYARYIVVGLLLVRKELVSKLYLELTGLVDIYTRTFKPVDQMEWQMVLQEISTFLESERKMVPLALDSSTPLPVQFRLIPNQSLQSELKLGLEPLSPAHPKFQTRSSNLRLQECIVMGSKSTQLKFSELTIDMYRMVLALEKEPNVTKNAISHPTETTEPSEEPTSLISSDRDDKIKLMNQTHGLVTPPIRRTPPPHKYLLFRPTLGQLMVTLATAYKDLSESSALLLYLSSDGIKSLSPDPAVQFGYVGGCATMARKPLDKTTDQGDAAIANCFHPADLIPFTRKPLMVIVECPASHTFKKLPQLFNQPQLLLLSPLESPFSDNPSVASILTQFLSSPLVAFCQITDLVELDPEQWSNMKKLMQKIEDKAVELFSTHPQVDPGVKCFLSDEFLKRLIARFILCYIILKNHRLTKGPKNLPDSHPQLPQSILDSTDLLNLFQPILDLTHTNLIFSHPTTTANTATTAATTTSATTINSNSNLTTTNTNIIGQGQDNEAE